MIPIDFHISVMDWRFQTDQSWRFFSRWKQEIMPFRRRSPAILRRMDDLYLANRKWVSSPQFFEWINPTKIPCKSLGFSLTHLRFVGSSPPSNNLSASFKAGNPSELWSKVQHSRHSTGHGGHALSDPRGRMGIWPTFTRPGSNVNSLRTWTYSYVNVYQHLPTRKGIWDWVSTSRTFWTHLERGWTYSHTPAILTRKPGC